MLPAHPIPVSKIRCRKDETGGSCDYGAQTRRFERQSEQEVCDQEIPIKLCPHHTSEINPIIIGRNSFKVPTRIKWKSLASYHCFRWAHCVEKYISSSVLRTDVDQMPTSGRFAPIATRTPLPLSYYSFFS